MEGGTNDDMIQKRFGLDIPVFVILQEKLEDILSKAPDWWGTSDKDIYDIICIFRRSSVKKQKCPDFTVRATQIGPQSEPKKSIFPPKHTLRRTCTSVYKWVDAIETDAGMPHNQVYCSTNLRKSKFCGSFFIPICAGCRPGMVDYYE